MYGMAYISFLCQSHCFINSWSMCCVTSDQKQVFIYMWTVKGLWNVKCMKKRFVFNEYCCSCLLIFFWQVITVTTSVQMVWSRKQVWTVMFQCNEGFIKDVATTCWNETWNLQYTMCILPARLSHFQFLLFLLLRLIEKKTLFCSPK